MSATMDRARLLKRAAGIALGAALLGELPPPAVDVSPTMQGLVMVDQQVFTSSGVWTKPAGATVVRVVAMGSGGGGGGSGSELRA